MRDRRDILRLGSGFAAGAAALNVASCVGGIAAEKGNGLLSVDYTLRDYEVVDYGFYELRQIPQIKFRGPPIDPSRRRDFFTCIGAAQTLGVYVERPFPLLISERLGIAGWNAGVGGATPHFFLQQPKLIDLANRGRFVIIQIMTARSEPNKRLMPLKAAELVTDRKTGESLTTPQMWKRISTEEGANLIDLIEQSRLSWNADSIELLKRIKVPVLLFWFSPKNLRAPIGNFKASGGNLLDAYPQFVTGANVDVIRPYAQDFVVSSSARGSGYPLRSRFTGEIVEVDYEKLGAMGMAFKETHNVYYPSPEMHEDAAHAILGRIESGHFHY